MWLKFELYILSLFLLFLLLVISKVPVSFDLGCGFVGWGILCTKYFIVPACVFFMVLGIIFFARFKYNFEGGSALLPGAVEEIENINFESVTFLATYIVPLACLDLDKERSTLILFLILFLIGWIYIKTNLFYTNPTLAIWGYQIYKISTKDNKKVVVIIRGKLQLGESVFLKHIDDNIFLAKKHL